LVPLNCVWRKVCFGSYLSSVYCGQIWREFVLVPIFPVTTSLHLAGSMFLVPIFPAFMFCIWREVCFGSYFSRAASGGKLFWFQFFQRLHLCIWRVVCIWFLFFQPLFCHIWREVCFGSYFSSVYCGIIWREFCFGSYFSSSNVICFSIHFLDCILYICQILILFLKSTM
jgi:hypothetical protein